MWSFADSIPEASLDTWYRWLTILAIGLPILGAIMGGVFGWGAFIVSARIGDLQTTHLNQAEQTISRQSVEIQSLKPREVLATQSNELLRLLTDTHGKIGFISQVMNGESADYGEKLARVFGQAGWDIAPAIRNSTNDLPGYVTLAGTNPKLEPLGMIVAKALNAAGIDCRPQWIQPNTVGGDLQTDTIYVVIGRK